MAIDFEHKTINDPIHGSIKISNIEARVIATPTFQRLRNLKHLGLAYFVFPGATHTRFAHSLGVLHIVSRMLDAVKRNSRKAFNKGEKQKIRLAALLHDVGHLPLSHAMEQPIRRLIWEEGDASTLRAEQGTLGHDRHFGPLDETAQAALDKSFGHESFGRDLLVTRKDLRAALKGFNANNEIGKSFSGARVTDSAEQHGIDVFSQFIKGTLDADRLDFLVRDASSSGFSFGHIDLDYILENLCMDQDDKLYVDYKGINALEHYITSRYFSYNVTYHKTVMGFELLAKHAYYRMCKTGNADIPSSQNQLEQITKDDISFTKLTDDFFWEQLRNWKPSDDDALVREALLNRVPPRLLFEERVLHKKETEQDLPRFDMLSDKNKFREIQSFSDRLRDHSIDEDRLAVTTNDVDFEQYAAQIMRSEHTKEEKLHQLCNVKFDDKPKPLVDIEWSIIHHLAYYRLWIRRLYYLQRTGESPLDRPKVRTDLRRAFNP